MAKGLSYLSVKCLRDSTGAVYVAAIGSLTDPVVSLIVNSEAVKFNITRLSSGHSQLAARLTSNPVALKYTVTFKSGKTETKNLPVPTDRQKLSVPFDSLTPSFSEVRDTNSQTFSFRDTLSYPEGKGQKQTVVYPASTSEKLDTSSKVDFYYISDGTLAYVASNDLQNQFLNNLQYRPAGTTSDSVGKFEGGTRNKSLAITTSSVTDTNVSGIVGPVIFGEVVAFDLPNIPPPGSGDDPIRVCTSPTAQNYWLRACTDMTLPCTDSGLAFPQDCSGTTLTPAIINEFSDNYVDGGCCVECDNDLVYTFTNIGDATQDTANGSVTITVTSISGADTLDVGYSLIGVPNNPDLTFTTVDVDLNDEAAPYTITYTNLLPGSYSLKAGNTPCTETHSFTIPEKEDTIPDSTFGCTDATAVNYDSTAGLTNLDELCVFCDEVTGMFTTGGTNNAEYSFPQVLPYVDITEAGSSPVGASSNDGVIHFSGESAEWALWNFDGYGIWNLGEDGYFQFVPANHLNSSEDLPFVHKLYKLNITEEEYSLLILDAVANGTSTKDVTTSNATLVATQTGNGSQEHTFTDLSAGNYLVITQYNNDGTLDGDDEIEQCYSILGLTGTVKVRQKGCTDPDALNYNPDAEISDGSCNYERDTDRECGKLNLELGSYCFPGDGSGNAGGWLVAKPLQFSDPELFQNYEDYVTTALWTQGPLGGSYVCNYELGPGSSGYNIAFWEYVIAEVFCMDQTNNGALFLDNWIQNPMGNGPEWDALPLECFSNLMYQPPVTNPFWPYESGDLFTFTNSNGDNLGATGMTGGQYLNIYRINFTVTFADGSTQVFEKGLWELYLGGNDTFGGIPLTQLICGSSAPVSYNYQYNWGSWDAWEYSYQSEEISLEEVVLDCCRAPQVPECTDPTALNYCCPEGTEGVITDNSLCEYPEEEERPGCTDPLSPNFDPLATIDDGSCPPPTTSGSWICSNAAAGECEYILNNLDGYATQAECEQNCLDTDPDDCLELSNWVNTNSGGMTATSTNATSVYNETTGLCDPDNDGTVTINIPDSSDLTIDNTNGVIFQVILWNSDIEYANYSEDGVDDYLSLSSYSGGTFTFTNVGPGCYGYALKFWSDTITQADTEQLVPSNATQYCEGYNNTICVSTNNCDDGNGGEEIIYDCTDPEAENYNPDATVDDGTCEYPCDPCEGECLCPDKTYDASCCPDEPICGCMDPIANNFNPAANIQDESCPCEYDVVGCTGPCCDGGCDGEEGGGDVDDGTDSVIPGCTPQNMDSLLNYNDQCITTSGNRFYTKLLTGLGDDCSTLEAWKMIIIQEILNRKGLPCIYNCSDESTVQIGAATNDCAARWQEEGSIYWNPTDAVGFGLGTIVKRANGGLGGVIYIAVSTSGLTIDPFSSDSNSGWKKCVTIKAPTDNSDYLEKFVSFAKSYCRDCGIPPYTQETETDDSQVSVEVTNGFTVGGSPVTNDGVSYEPPQ